MSKLNIPIKIILWKSYLCVISTINFILKFEEVYLHCLAPISMCPLFCLLQSKLPCPPFKKDFL